MMTSSMSRFGRHCRNFDLHDVMATKDIPKFDPDKSKYYLDLANVAAPWGVVLVPFKHRNSM